MPRGKRSYEEIDNQMHISDFLLDVSLPVVQSYTLINGKQSLKVNSAKLIRSAIMQLTREDRNFKPYVITIQEIADLLGISKSNVYRDIESITDDILKNPVEIKQNDGKKEKWVKIPWVKRCEYNSDIGLLILLNDDLAPMLFNLQDFMAQYPYEEIGDMKSIYSLRIFELVMSRLHKELEPNEEAEIVITIKEIKESCNCEDYYKEYSNLKLRVIDPAVKEICKNTSYHFEYRPLKASRSVVALEFTIRLKKEEVIVD